MNEFSDNHYLKRLSDLSGRSLTRFHSAFGGSIDIRHSPKFHTSGGLRLKGQPV
ncbi:hypothetical protein D1AOALGA4SA_12450 [Olavius algarvensis Delta 1 endosymbiont]|nr:hypothetical protein D1AOALGA4SA_12450 [Olavius algarvensis Delta 1 endosymbiont]